MLTMNPSMGLSQSTCHRCQKTFFLSNPVLLGFRFFSGWLPADAITHTLALCLAHRVSRTTHADGSICIAPQVSLTVHVEKSSCLNLSKFFSDNASEQPGIIISPQEYLTAIMGLRREQINAILKRGKSTGGGNPHSCVPDSLSSSMHET